MKKEPVLAAMVAQWLVMAAAKYGLELSTEHAVALTGAIASVLALVVRKFVTPVAKLPSAPPPSGQ